MELKKLNLLMDYSVKWSIETVINNFIQNFYDAVGPIGFKDRFYTEYHDGLITMFADEVFSKEWLFYMGVSTKRNSEKYAGHFGEGFKVASLVAYRDYGIEITMESADWRIRVTKDHQIIAGNDREVLAYLVEERTYASNSILTLSGTNEELYKQVLVGKKDFFFPDNPRFGEVIIEKDEFAIYKAAPTKGRKTLGGIFINYQYRYTLSFPIYICNHSYQVDNDDRDRDSLSERNAKLAFLFIARDLGPESSMKVLEIMRPMWWNYHDRSWRRTNWYIVIYSLIVNISQDSITRDKFSKKYKDLLLADPIWKFYGRYQKTIAYRWLRTSEYKNRSMVGDLFTRLGIKSLGTLCKENGVFDIEADPSETQAKRIKILETIAKEFFYDLLCYDSLPECKILVNKENMAHGTAQNRRIDTDKRNEKGLRVKNYTDRINITRVLIDGDSLAEALPVYMHELLHQFGGDSSPNFHKALKYMHEIILEKGQDILRYEDKWKSTSRYTT